MGCTPSALQQQTQPQPQQPQQPQQQHSMGEREQPQQQQQSPPAQADNARDANASPMKTPLGRVSNTGGGGGGGSPRSWRFKKASDKDKDKDKEKEKDKERDKGCGAPLVPTPAAPGAPAPLPLPRTAHVQRAAAEGRLGNVVRSHTQSALKVLLVFPKDDAQAGALRGAAGQLGHECSLARTAASALDAFQSRCHDMVVVDNRDPKALDGIALAKALRNERCSQYSVLIAVVKRMEPEKQDISVLPYLDAGYDRWLQEAAAVGPCVGELLQLETAEVQPRRQLWAYHSFMLAAERSRELCIITDYAHNIAYANRAAERAAGCGVRELVGRPVHEAVRLEGGRDRMLASAVRGREWEGLATVVPQRPRAPDPQPPLAPLLCRVVPNCAAGRAPANLVFLLEAPGGSKRGSEAGMSGRGSVPSVRRGSSDMRSVCSDGRSWWAFIRDLLTCGRHGTSLSACRRRPRRRRSSVPPPPPAAITALEAKARPDRILSEATDGRPWLRRQSVTKLNQFSIEAPITQVITLIGAAQEASSPEVSLMLDKVVDILRTTELYSPIVREDRLRPGDPVTSDLISALLQQGGTMPVSVTRRSSNDSAVTRPPASAASAASRPSRPTPVSAAASELQGLLDTALLWDFELFRLETITSNRPLVHLGMNVMQHFEVAHTLCCDDLTMQNWLTIIEMNYKANNTYHNSTHAADVLQASAVFLERERLQRIMDPLDAAACLIAAAVHDVDHPGKSSAFLCNADHDLAILYNDICVLESHHAAFAFKLTMSDDRVNIFKGLERDVYKTLRQSIIDMVLATEMTRHFEHLAKFVNVFSKPARDDEDNALLQTSQALLGESDVSGALMTADNVALVKRMLIKCADVSNPARPVSMCVEWARRIAEEYFNQTDEEKAKQLPVVMPMFDRNTCSIPKSQIGFMDFIINDMFEAWEAFIEMPELMQNLEHNYAFWKEKEAQGVYHVPPGTALQVSAPGAGGEGVASPGGGAGDAAAAGPPTDALPAVPVASAAPVADIPEEDDPSAPS